ncbi:hypothetical protein LTS15_005279 [Exophiala xenobiotica]|nr:hypothetical protein LTS15_005279 [Exophiala xenobiotica]
MDQEYGSNVPLRGGIPRLSRLPMPRASASIDNLKLAARSSAVPGMHQDDLRKKSNLPRPAGPPGPLGENFNQKIRSRFAWNDKSGKPRSASPVRDALRDAHTAALDTTPPGPKHNVPVFEDGSENPINGGIIHETKDRRKPRPSLSERTIETLSTVSPCPSPVTRRPNLFSTDGMPPPGRPTSRISRPATPATPRPESPSKRPFRPPGRTSPTKDVAPLPPVMSPGDIYTPPKAFVRGQRSRIAKPLRDPRRSASSTFDISSSDHHIPPSGEVSAQTMRSKPVYSSKTISSSSTAPKPSLASIFRDPAPGPAPTSRHESKNSASETGPKPTVAKPRSKPQGKSSMKSQQDQDPLMERDTQAAMSPKSSAVLRETIAKAKAARRGALRKSTGALEKTSTDPACELEIPAQTVDRGDNKGLVRKRVQQAVTTGHLNIARMSLKRIPPEVMSMYDPEDQKLNWSEMVDLTKMTAADNEIEELEERFFPDYSESELENDDDKSNQFGGLEVIDLHRNHIRQLPVGIRRLTRLHSLNLSGNKLLNNALEIIGQIPQLKELMLGENLIGGAIVLKSGIFEHLQVLDLHGNAIERLEEETLSQLKSLKKLDISSNKLSRVPWGALVSLPLAELNVSKNQLSGMLFEQSTSLPELRVLDGSYNNLEGVSVDELHFSSLRALNLDGNRLVKLPGLTRCRHLQTLTVAENQLDDVPQDLSQLEALVTADFGHNSIRVIPPEIAGMKSLSSMNLAGNPLREKKYLTISTAELKSDLEKRFEAPEHGTDFLEGNSKTESGYRFKASKGTLDMSSQSLSAINLFDIELDGSEGPIRTLKLSNNDLTRFPVELLAHPMLKYSLQLLDLSHNPLLHSTEYLTSELFLPNLKSLYIVSTGLTSLDALTTYLKAPVLEELNISCHRLAGRVPWVRAWWPTCTTLLATDNWFSSVDVEGVRGLEVLDIRNNEIEMLPTRIGLLGNKPGSVKECGKLRSLEVSGNRFRVPRLAVVEKGTDAVLKDLRRMITLDEVPEEWKEFI